MSVKIKRVVLKHLFEDTVKENMAQIKGQFNQTGLIGVEQKRIKEKYQETNKRFFTHQKTGRFNKDGTPRGGYADIDGDGLIDSEFKNLQTNIINKKNKIEVNSDKRKFSIILRQKFTIYVAREDKKTINTLYYFFSEGTGGSTKRKHPITIPRQKGAYFVWVGKNAYLPGINARYYEREALNEIASLYAKNKLFNLEISQANLPLVADWPNAGKGN